MNEDRLRRELGDDKNQQLLAVPGSAYDQVSLYFSEMLNKKSPKMKFAIDSFEISKFDFKIWFKNFRVLKSYPEDFFLNRPSLPYR